MTTGEQIKQRREELHLSQEELAERISVSRQAVSKWESGQAVPRGTNRDELCKLLSIELNQPEPAEKSRFFAFAGWIAAAFLLLCAIWLWTRQSPAASIAAPTAPTLQSVRFYDANQEVITPEAGWYVTDNMESILIQWSSDLPPESVQMFFTPSGTETLDETELLATKLYRDGGGNALLLSAAPLHRESLMGHLWFQLNFPQEQTVVSDSYNVIFQP